MERLNHDLHIHHFSHPHLLELKNPHTLTLPPCSACKLPSSGWMYICRPCNFTLHVSCTPDAPVDHPPLSSSSRSQPPSDSDLPPWIFGCDGCGDQVQGFSYHCTHYNFDLHILCASKPLTVTHQFHSHQLNLTFDTPYQTTGFLCDICRKPGSNHWLYRCKSCNFDAHLDCESNVNTTRPFSLPQTQPQQVQIQQYNSFPRANQMQYGNRPGTIGMNNNNNNNQFIHSRSMGVMPLQNNYQATATAAGRINNNTITGNPLMDAAAQGFAQGAAVQVGQNFVQSLTIDGNGENDNRDPGNNAEDPSSTSIIGIGSSIINGIFSDSETYN